MYEIIKNVIKSGNFELTDIIKKINTCWISGKITENQRNELIQLSQEKANPQNSVDILQKMAELEKRIKVLEDKQLESDNTEGEGTGEAPSEEIIGYVAGKWYYNGDKVFFDGKNYGCIAPEGQTCVWSPSEYPAYWQAIE